ncbi:MAG: hypothetical protein DRQ78_08295 [Epsilonproteobacteria bacterium]|nr:MAG: hypothetical protein DRQ78_08295 [Campylobacterota bacterium]
MNKKMNDTGILQYLEATLSESSSFHVEALGAVQTSRDAYNGELTSPADPNWSSIVVKDIKRIVNGAIPSLVEPFMTDTIVSLETNKTQMVDGLKKSEALLNYQWQNTGDPMATAELAAINQMVDGTAWAMTGWDAKGHPTINIVPFESVIPDPSAYDVNDMKFIIYRRKVTISDILKNPKWFGKHSLESLNVLSAPSTSEYDPAPTLGREDSYDPGNRALEEVEVFEYYGYLDTTGDGIATPFLGIWSNGKLLRSGENPYPGFVIPFDRAVYSRKPFSVYGETIEELVGDYQKLRTSITRGIIDNMANSNNGTRFVKKNALDSVNFQRLLDNERVVELNIGKDAPVRNAIEYGTFNPLPADVYKMLEDTMKEEENITGITRYSVGSDSRSLNQTATGIGIITDMSQRRLTYLTAQLAVMFKGVILKWAKLNAAIITDVTVKTPRGYVQIAGPELVGDEFGITMNTPTAGLKQKKQSELTAMIQSLAPMTGLIGPEILLGLLMEMADLADMPKLRDELYRITTEVEQNKGQMSEEQQLALQKVQVELGKTQSETMENVASAKKSQADADKANMETLIASFGGADVNL